MFTVKLVSDLPDNSEELLYQARHVTYRRSDGKSADEPRGVKLHAVNGDDGLSVQLQAPASTVYVMNSAGSTVAVYSL